MNRQVYLNAFEADTAVIFPNTAERRCLEVTFHGPKTDYIVHLSAYQLRSFLVNLEPNENPLSATLAQARAVGIISTTK